MDAVKSAAVLFFLGLIIPHACGDAAEHSVVPGTSLQTLVNRAGAGDSLVLFPGLYEGNLVIQKRLSLIGRGKPVVRGEGRGSVITVLADSCIVQGLVIERCGTMLVDEDAGILLKGSSNRLEGNLLRDILFGIYLLKADSNLVAGNEIVGRGERELGERGSGIHIWNSHHNRFTDNRVTDVRDGLYIQNANHTWIERNDVSSVRYGVHYMYADSNTFLLNSFRDNVAGAAVMYSRGIRMRHNVFLHNRGFSSFGILFQDCHGLLADSNIIANNVVGMFFEATTNSVFRANVIAQNDIALQMFQNSTDNVFTCNSFIDNLNPLAIVGKRTSSRWSDSGRGNYWSSYGGYDIDANGIGDVPMRIQNVFQYLEGRNPNLRFYLYSPASQALALAAEAFPVIRINEEEDGFPLMSPIPVELMPALRLTRASAAAHVGGGSARGATWVAFPLAGIVALTALFRRVSRRRWS